MTERERFLETLLFGTPDRVPLTPGGGRKSTRERWYSEGLPREVGNIAEYAYRLAGGKEEWPRGGPSVRPSSSLARRRADGVQRGASCGLATRSHGGARRLRPGR